MTYQYNQKQVGSNTYSEWRIPCSCNRFWNNVEREDCVSGECSALTYAAPPEHSNWAIIYLLYSVKPQIFYWESAVCIILHVYTLQRFLARNDRFSFRLISKNSRTSVTKGEHRSVSPACCAVSFSHGHDSLLLSPTWNVLVHSERRYRNLTHVNGQASRWNITMMMMMDNTVFWDVTPCIPAEVHRRLRVTYCLHFVGRKPRQIRKQLEVGGSVVTAVCLALFLHLCLLVHLYLRIQNAVMNVF